MIQQLNEALCRSDRHRQECIEYKMEQHAKKSARTTDSVVRLSAVAFLFIPLSFVTSCFGMNLAILGTGTAPLWTPILMALGLFTFALFMWAISKWFDDRAKLVRGRLSSLALLLPTWRLIFHHPRVAWVLLRNALARPPSLTSCMLRDTRLNEYFGTRVVTANDASWMWRQDRQSYPWATRLNSIYEVSIALTSIEATDDESNAYAGSHTSSESDDIGQGEPTTDCLPKASTGQEHVHECLNPACVNRPSRYASGQHNRSSTDYHRYITSSTK